MDFYSFVHKSSLHCAWQVTRMSDVYSFGVVLLELVTGRRAVETMANGTRCNLVDAVSHTTCKRPNISSFKRLLESVGESITESIPRGN